MYEFHSNLELYFNMQFWTTRDFILPEVQKLRSIGPRSRVLELGCAEAGVLKAFVDLGCTCVGLDLSPERIATATKFQAEAVQSGQLRFISKNVYDIDVDADFGGKFDLILLKDVIEHIPDQEKFIPILKNYLNDDGIIFFGFPPWYMPFGGHQQVCRSKILSKLPWFHLLPKSIYRAILIRGGEYGASLQDYMDIHDCGISIERFERIAAKSSFRILKKITYFTNPIYVYKFGVKPRKWNSFFSGIPFLRNFYSTAVYYFLSK
ncbi:MAG: class I SAM-dependent methyltransferase [Saprospiraceae bacterium]|jgi:SAM-dependent methyltransferase|nr:class I SAM-dependent methyltransferase [Saprospiraceae bacterium]MBK7795327.1 class I SAM-dependent methyltransferase [Saprospiraceae bacterium]MBL0262251.1 class I SAM-dependent methyltransferase [Saprospiraceae bacterium]MBX7162362.1 class I SAM-dependent methyltransferase [Saprospiraceae bacterium]